MSIVTANPPLPLGYSPVPPGMLANVVTCLEMFERPHASAPSRPDHGLVVEHWPEPDLDDYRALFRMVGEDWMWVSRLVMPDETLRGVLADPRVEVYVLRDAGRAIGLLELDFRREDECELAYFGLVGDAIGKGAGRVLMDHAIDFAWSRPIRRFWVHTCHFDHPSAPAFYQRSGFRPYAFFVEVGGDPRLTGLLPRSAAPHVPLLEG